MEFKKGNSPLDGTIKMETGSVRSTDTASDASLVNMTTKSNKHFKLCIGVTVALVVLATVLGVALYISLTQIRREEEETRQLVEVLTADVEGDNNQLQQPIEVPPQTPVRLVGGEADYTGRVLVQLNDEWGTVCGMDWTENEASAVCRSLGYESGSPESGVGPGSGPILLSDVHCPPHMASLDDCSTSDWGKPRSNCTHHHDVAVTCQGSADVRAPPEQFHRHGSWSNYYYQSYVRCWSQVSCVGPSTCYCSRLTVCSYYVTWKDCRDLTTTSPTSTTLGPVALDPTQTSFRYLADQSDLQVQVYSGGEWLPFSQTDSTTMSAYICSGALPVRKKSCWTSYYCYSRNNCYISPYYTWTHNYFNLYINCPNVPQNVAVLTPGTEISVYLAKNIVARMDSLGYVRVAYGYYNWVENYLKYIHPYSGYSNYRYLYTYQYICSKLLASLGTTTAQTTPMSTSLGPVVPDPSQG